MRHQTLWVTGVVIGALACGELGPEDYLPPGSPPPVTTDAAVYPLAAAADGYTGWARATYTNRTGRTVYFDFCNNPDDGPLAFVRRTGPDSIAPTVVGTYTAWSCGESLRLGVLPPGGTLVTSVDLGSPDYDLMPPITPEQRIGQYRIELVLCTEQTSDTEDCDWLPQAARESDAFEVRFPEP
jgi:hypothetical protein